MPNLYRVQIGEDVYVGTAVEVLQFMMRAEGAPGTDITTYMEGVSARIAERLGIDGIVRDDPEGFLESIAEKGVVPVQILAEPSDERTPPKEYIGEDIVTFAEDVDPEDVDLD